MNKKINLANKLGLFDTTWTPKIIAELNGQQVKLAKLEGELTWHSHEHEDELFMVITGQLTMQMRDERDAQSEVIINPGELFVVPRGVQHNPIAVAGTSVMLFEPIATKHTGEKMIERTVTDQAWI